MKEKELAKTTLQELVEQIESDKISSENFQQARRDSRAYFILKVLDPSTSKPIAGYHIRNEELKVFLFKRKPPVFPSGVLGYYNLSYDREFARANGLEIKVIGNLVRENYALRVAGKLDALKSCLDKKPDAHSSKPEGPQ